MSFIKLMLKPQWLWQAGLMTVMLIHLHMPEHLDLGNWTGNTQSHSASWVFADWGTLTMHISPSELSSGRTHHGQWSGCFEGPVLWVENDPSFSPLSRPQFCSCQWTATEPGPSGEERGRHQSPCLCLRDGSWHSCAHTSQAPLPLPSLIPFATSPLCLSSSLLTYPKCLVLCPSSLHHSPRGGKYIYILWIDIIISPRRIFNLEPWLSLGIKRPIPWGPSILMFSISAPSFTPISLIICAQGQKII